LKFDEVLTEKILHSFSETPCINVGDQNARHEVTIVTVARYDCHNSRLIVQ